MQNHLTFTPSDLIRFMESDFAAWMDRYLREHPDEFAPDAADEAVAILAKKGLEHEIAFLKSLQDAGDDVFIVPREDAQAHTSQAMQEGRKYIYQAALRDRRFHGYADFLVKVSGRSQLGDYHYEPWDTKLALKPKPYYIIQLCCYAEILESIQGVRPSQICVVLGSKDRKVFRTDDFFFYYKQLKARFLKMQSEFDFVQRPSPNGLDDHGRWNSVAAQILEDQDHLCRVANVRKTQIKKLEKNGIASLRSLANSAVETVAKMDKATFETLRKQAKIQVESVGLEKPCFEVINHGPNARRGLALLPPAAANDVWFDMEGYPHMQGGLEYLFGASYINGAGNLQFIDWWAHDRVQERKAFEDFIDWVHGRFVEDQSMHIYHYAAYEVSAMRKLMGRFGTREVQVDDLLRNEVFVDLYKVVQQGLRVGEPRYSLKNIEHLYMKRSGDVAKATDSIVYYERWLEQQDGADFRTSQILKDIRDYNQIDCDSTYHLTNWLRERQLENGMRFIAKPQLGDEATVAIVETPAGNLAAKILNEVALSSSLTKEQKDFKELLAYLLEFHKRENKTVWWAKFERAAMEERELIENFDCLGGLRRTDKPPEPVKKSRLIEYQFDPAQDTKLAAGKTCHFAHDTKVRVVIESLDANSGVVLLKFGPSVPEVPDRLSLIPDEYVSPEPIPGSILKQVSGWSSAQPLSRAIEDFFMRNRPNLKGNRAGSILTSDGTQIEQINRAILSMDCTTLCIQGPPGTGKTYTASHAIAALFKAGKTVGISSNGHKAIAHLLDKAADVATKGNVAFRAVKVQTNAVDFHATHPSVQRAATIRDVFAAGQNQFTLIGGTAWAFSNEASEGKLDYLFVDEAGQVSIANLLGMAASTKNIVLMGDQMQLSQPIKGSHPGESGTSCLEYLLQKKQTIPEDFGIFLDTSYRMHPDVCGFISDAVYEGRLKADSITSTRMLNLPSIAGGVIAKSTGVLFVPVEHDGNNQSSDEEVEAISGLVSELLLCTLSDLSTGSERKITLADFLFVAPYNMQVRALQAKFPTAKVGTVDKFQGQEAPIVIVSMCSSDASDSSRGLEFLLSKNRMNVAISRAQVLAIVVGSPRLATVACGNLEQLELVNLFCRITQN